MRIVIVGTGGRLGGELVRRLSPGHDVVALERGDLDLGDPAAIRSVLGALDYDRLLLPGALTVVDYCEDHSDEAFRVNGDAPGIIAEISSRKGAHVTYFSTDFVFDGEMERPYREDDPVNPISIYGSSKARGEENVLSASERNLVVRVSWLYGGGKAAFPEWIIDQAMKHDSISLPGEKVGTTTRAEDFAKWLEPMLGLNGAPPASGIFHLSNSGSCSWREWGQRCLEEAEERGLPLKSSHVAGNRLSDIKAFVARRPVNSRLDTAAFTQATGIFPRDWREALGEHFDNSPLFPLPQPSL